MVVLFLEGGLGNQLFQYAAAANLAELRHGDDVFIDTEFYKGVGNRKYELNKFKLPKIHIASEKEKSGLKYRIAKEIILMYSGWVKKNKAHFNERLNKVVKALLCRWGIYICGGTALADTPIPTIIIKKKNIYLYGYFLHPRFFHNISFELKSESPGLVSWKKNNASGEHICIHIRLGDYVNNNTFEVCTKKYYYDSMKYIAQKISDPIFHVFSDDIKCVKKEFEFPFPVKYEEEKNTCECLVKMSQCKHFILSNSTFSWWAQKLAKNRGKIVVAPTQWYKDKNIPFYLYSNSWKMIKP